MEINELPKLNMADNPTGCCPRFEPEDWDGQTFVFQDKLFAKASTVNFMHVPLNMASVMKKSWAKIQAADAYREGEFAILSYDPSPFKGDHYFTVTKEVDGMENVRLSGTYLTKVFEGPYKESSTWVKAMHDYIKSQGKELKKLYFYYTTCPKCVKFYGKNYVVAFAEI